MKAGKESAPALRPERSLMFFKGQLLWQSRTARGEQFKFVSPAAVLQALKAGPVDTGWLAPGVVRAGSTARGGFAVLVVPAGRAAIRVEKQSGAGVETLTLHLPAFAFFGHGQAYHVWALKKEADPARALLFRAPLPNVFDDGRVCWGANTPPAASPSSVAEAWRLFLDAPFNGHAASGKVRGERGDVRPYLRRLARSRGKFPAADLLPIGSYGTTTLDAQINRLFGGDYVRD
jgi:PRTRC genetic system protein B